MSKNVSNVFMLDSVNGILYPICKNILSIFFLFLLLNPIDGQKIEGRIIDADAQGIPFANVLLLDPLDSTLVKGELTDDSGNYSFSEIDNGEYLIAGSYIGFNTSYSDVINASSTVKAIVEDIILLEGITLDQVQVVAKKPLFEQKIDRLVVNVAGSITASGSTALEVLERSPGVVVNKQNNAISLIGKEGVVIMINGRISYQPSESIVQMLSGMSSDNIESIELITTPPANFNAEGNAGYINIVLKQRTDLGLSGSTSVSLGYGEGEKGSAGINLNYRKGKLNLYSNYNFSLKAQKQIIQNYRKVTNGSSILENNLITDRDPQQVIHNLIIGADYQLTPKTILGVLVTTIDDKWTMNAFNSSINKIDNAVNNKITLDNEEENRWKHFITNINLEQGIGENGKLSMNVDYLSINDNNPNDYEIKFLDSNNSEIGQNETRSSKVTPIDILVSDFDYTNTISDKVSFMVGAKLGHSEFINTVSAETFSNGNWEFIDQFTNESDLTENIAAGFASVDYAHNQKNKFKFGLRYEHTDSKLNTIKEGNVVDRQFGVLFPSAFYSRTIDDNRSFTASYSKRITRPAFNDMAPFAIFLDPNTFFFGNAGLQPAITNNVKLDYRYKSYLFTVQYSKEDSTIARFQDRVDVENNQQLFEPTNLSQTTIYSASLSIPIYVGNNYSIQNSFIGIHGEARSFYDGTPINLSRTAYNISSTHSYSLDNSHSLEARFFYNSASISGRAEYEAIYGIDVGAQKKFSNGSALRFNISDVLNSIKMQGGTNIPSEGFLTEGVFDFSNRTFSLSYNFNFGNDKLKSSRDRVTASDEERQRVN